MSASGRSSPSGSDFAPSASDWESDKENIDDDSPPGSPVEPPRASYAELDTTKINRLLRPLKAKCTHLANFSETFAPPVANQAPRMITTYSHYHRTHRPHSNRTEPLSAESSVPPLAILAEPEMIRPTRLQRIGDTGTIELSRRVYAIRDCLRNLLDTVYLKGVYTAPHHAAKAPRFNISRELKETEIGPELVSKKERIPSLRDLCCVVAGRNMRLEKPDLDDEAMEERDVEETVGVDEETELIDELYDSIFPSYRRRTLTSHALTHILETDKVNRNQTLLTSILGLILEHDPPLVPESYAIVRTLLTSALNRGAKKKSPPPVCHDSHASWLGDLHRICCVQNVPPKIGAWQHVSISTMRQKTVLNTRAFLRLVMDTLSAASVEDVLEVWRSKAMGRWLDRMRNSDDLLLDYFYFLPGMADAIVRAMEDTSLSKNNLALEDLQAAFCDALHASVQWLCPPSVSSESSPESKKRPRRFLYSIALTPRVPAPRAPSPERSFEGGMKRPSTPNDLQAVVDFIINIYSLGLHTLSASAVSEALQCLLAVCAVGAPIYGNELNAMDKHRLEEMLREVTPASSMFEHLTSGIVNRTLGIFANATICATTHVVDSSWESFNAFAKGLRERGLARLEAAWWVCALKSFELVLQGRIGSATTLFTAKRERERWEDVRGWLMEEVERSEEAAYAYAETGSGEWEWEEMIECWVRKDGRQEERKGKRRMVAEDEDEDDQTYRHEARAKKRRVHEPESEPEYDDYSSTLAESDPVQACRSDTSSPDPISSFMKLSSSSGCWEKRSCSPIGKDRYDDDDRPQGCSDGDEVWAFASTNPDPVREMFSYSSDDTLDLFAYGSPSSP